MSSGRFDVLVVGGGASGMAAAITAKNENPELSVAIVEKGERMGRKLAITGNGRCNISNVEAFGAGEVRRFLESCGILLRQDEDGRLYPCSEDAGQVAAFFAELAAGLGVEIFLNTEVKKVEACHEGGFLLLVDGLPSAGRRDQSELRAEKVVLATGGKSYPKTGSTGDGYVFARALGHKVSPLRPALVPVCVKPASGQGYSLKDLAGVRAKARVRLLEKGKELKSAKGEVQFREDSLSGICVLEVSGFALPHGSLGPEGYADYEISIDFMPNMDEQKLAEHFEICGVNGHVLRTIVKGKLAKVLLAEARRESGCQQLACEHIADQIAEPEVMARVLKDFRLQVTGLKGWKEAQVTAGGVAISEVDLVRMESKLVPGLFITGEVLDFASGCGGYNLGLAWLTGSRAGWAAAGGHLKSEE
jgi:predicted Rossmann fold flavoprotein